MRSACSKKRADGHGHGAVQLKFDARIEIRNGSLCAALRCWPLIGMDHTDTASLNNGLR